MPRFFVPLVLMSTLEDALGSWLALHITPWLVRIIKSNLLYQQLLPHFLTTQSARTAKWDSEQQIELRYVKLRESCKFDLIILTKQGVKCQPSGKIFITHFSIHNILNKIFTFQMSMLNILRPKWWKLIMTWVSTSCYSMSKSASLIEATDTPLSHSCSVYIQVRDLILHRSFKHIILECPYQNVNGRPFWIIKSGSWGSNTA